MSILVPLLLACGAAADPPPPVLPPPPAPIPALPTVATERALTLLGSPPGCSAAPAPVPCALQAAYAGHPAELTDALALWDEFGDVAGLGEAATMDGGFRGTLTLVPELPVGPHARLLRDVLAAQRSTRALLAEMSARAPGPLAWRHTAVGWRFFRSVKRRTPSAYAEGWEVAVNVSGSLLGTAAGVEETLVHELFHSNDQAAGGWSRRALGTLVDGIVARCGTRDACLVPYAPGHVRVRGGTFYAFQPDNGDPADEYGAELASRYFAETRAILAGVPPKAPFRCGPPENRAAWDALVAAFMGGLDLTPACEA